MGLWSVTSAALLLQLVQVSSKSGICLTNEECLVKDHASGATTSRLVGNTVDNTTYCCHDRDDYIDMTLEGPGNVSCHCTTAVQAAAAYADRTMGEGRACHWGADCEGTEETIGLNDTTSFCCLGNGHQYTRTTHFGAKEVVCRCYGSKMPATQPDKYRVPETNNATSSGESCSYNHDCADWPSTLCLAERVTFCCYGSRGLETDNDPVNNITRCTCTNDFTGMQCAEDPYPLDPGAEEAECRSGNACRETDPRFTCSHGDVTFCCPQQGVDLTILDDVIARCTCVSAGHLCNVTSTTSGSPSVEMSWPGTCAVGVLIILVFRTSCT